MSGLYIPKEGFDPDPMVIVLITVVPVITLTVPEPLFPTYKRLLFGLNVPKEGLLPTVIVVDNVVNVRTLTVFVPEFPTYTQSKDFPEFKVNSKDGSEFIVDPTFSYYVDTKFVPRIFKHYRKRVF